MIGGMNPIDPLDPRVRLAVAALAMMAGVAIFLLASSRRSVTVTVLWPPQLPAAAPPPADDDAADAR